MYAENPELNATMKAQGGHRIFTLANAISASRIVGGPVCAFLLATRNKEAVAAALAVMLLAEASDLLDGYVARLTGQVSAPGKILDPMADALYRGLVFLAFAFNGWIPVWMMAPIFVRDLIVANLREYAERQGKTQGARLSGKIKAIVQGAAQLGIVGLAVFVGVDGTTLPLFSLLMLAAVGVTVYSLVDYIVSILRKSA
jgi:CDP-diacylglycerol---glycerol-3-phosphate 3-phosphatidyltransferase